MSGPARAGDLGGRRPALLESELALLGLRALVLRRFGQRDAPADDAAGDL